MGPEVWALRSEICGLWKKTKVRLRSAPVLGSEVWNSGFGGLWGLWDLALGFGLRSGVWGSSSGTCGF